MDLIPSISTNLGAADRIMQRVAGHPFGEVGKTATHCGAASGRAG